MIIYFRFEQSEEYIHIIMKFILFYIFKSFRSKNAPIVYISFPLSPFILVNDYSTVIIYN